MEPLRDNLDYGEKGHRPQDYTEDEIRDLAKSMSVASRNKIAAKLVSLAKRVLGAPKLESGDKVKDSVTKVTGWVSEKKGNLYFVSVSRKDDDTGYWQDPKNLKLVEKADAEW